MKKEFHDSYNELYANYLLDNDKHSQSTHSSEFELINIIRQAIDESNYIIGNKLRPDAKFFLLVNFHQLIVRPLINKRSFNDLMNDIVDNIQTDIIKIISESSKIEGQNIISGHQILKTIDTLWKNLRTTKLEIWG